MSSTDVERVKKVQLSLNVNGQNYVRSIESRTLLLDLLRSDLNLTGTKRGCDTGNCGACTVMIDGKTRLSCLTFALTCRDKDVLTIEGLEENGVPHPIQKAFVETDALQCGFCTPGQIISIKGLLDQNVNPKLRDVKRAISGNICRCGAYNKIFEAALLAAQRIRE